MPRVASQIKVSYLFHAAVEGELRRHAARTGISIAEIIRRAYDLYFALMYQYNGTIPPEMARPAVQADGSAYPNTTKRITFFIDPYLAHKLKDWPGQEAHLLGYSVLCYIGLWKTLNPDEAADPDFTYQGATGLAPYLSADEESPTGEPNGEATIEEDAPDQETLIAGDAEATDMQGTPIVSEQPQLNPAVLPLTDPEQTELAGSAPEDEEEIFTEAEASPDHLDEEGNPTQDVHGNPIGTLYDAEGQITNLDRDGNLIIWDEHGYPEGTTYGPDGEPTNLDQDGFPIIQNQAA